LSRAEPQSRREFTSSAGVGDLQTVGTSAGRSKPRLRRPDRWPHPKPLCASAALRETNNADPTTTRSKSRSPPNPDRSRRAAEPQRAHLKRGRWGPPGRRHRSGTLSPRPASPRPLAPPQTSLRLCGSAREKPRRPHHHPLEEPIAATPGQVAQSRRAAESSPQARALGTSRPSAPERDAQGHSGGGGPEPQRAARPSDPPPPPWFVRPTRRRALPPPLPAAARPARPSPQLLVVATPPRGAPPPRLPFAARRAQHDAPHPGAAASSGAIHAP
jgi:hypothetical protein